MKQKNYVFISTAIFALMCSVTLTVAYDGNYDREDSFIVGDDDEILTPPRWEDLEESQRRAGIPIAPYHQQFLTQLELSPLDTTRYDTAAITDVRSFQLEDADDMKWDEEDFYDTLPFALDD